MPGDSASWPGVCGPAPCQQLPTGTGCTANPPGPAHGGWCPPFAIASSPLPAGQPPLGSPLTPGHLLSATLCRPRSVDVCRRNTMSSKGTVGRGPNRESECRYSSAWQRNRPSPGGGRTVRRWRGRGGKLRMTRPTPSGPACRRMDAKGVNGGRGYHVLPRSHTRRPAQGFCVPSICRVLPPPPRGGRGP